MPKRNCWGCCVTDEAFSKSPVEAALLTMVILEGYPRAEMLRGLCSWHKQQHDAMRKNFLDRMFAPYLGRARYSPQEGVGHENPADKPA